MKNLFFLLFFHIINSSEISRNMIVQTTISINDKNYELIIYQKPTVVNKDLFHLELKLNDEVIAILDFKNNDEQTCEVLYLYVHPEKRNKKNGTFVMEYLCKYLKTKNIKKVLVLPVPFEIVKNKNCYFTGDEEIIRTHKLFKFYANLGFEFSGVYWRKNLD